MTQWWQLGSLSCGAFTDATLRTKCNGQTSTGLIKLVAAGFPDLWHLIFNDAILTLSLDTKMQWAIHDSFSHW